MKDWAFFPLLFRLFSSVAILFRARRAQKTVKPLCLCPPRKNFYAGHDKHNGERALPPAFTVRFLYYILLQL